MNIDYKHSAADIAAELGSDIEKGLSIEKAHERIHSRGRNAIRLPKVRKTVAGLWKNVFSVINAALLLMAIVHLIAGGSSGAWLSLCFVFCALTNAAVGYISFYKGGSVAASAQSAQNQSIRVVRSGLEKTVGAVLLTQGDIILLEKGQTVPADAKIAECESLVADESVLSGDSSSVTKSPRCEIEDESVTMLYMGTKILEGSAKAVVVATGNNTQLGGVADMLENEPERVSSFVRRIATIGNICGTAAAVMWFAALVIRLFGGFGVVSAFDNSIAAAITAIPVSLSAVLLITMSLDVFRLRKSGIDLRSISAVEGLGAASVLCVGKRGMITEPGFTVGEVKAANGFEPDRLRLMAAMCTSADIVDGKPTGDAMQTALIAEAIRVGFGTDEIRSSRPNEKILDNRSSKRIMTTIHRDGGKFLIITKGAPDAVLACCSDIYDNGVRPLDPLRDLTAVMGEGRLMAEKAFTVIGVAFKEAASVDDSPEGGLTFAGLIGLSNPVRRDTAAAVSELNSMGVRLCVITNDNLTSAAAFGKELGIAAERVVRAEPNTDRIRKNMIFAETRPSEKAELVASINSGRESVACAGRSAKDINAMGKADVSLATDAAAKVCISAADVAVSGGGISGIAAAMRECRRTFINNDRLIGYLLSCNAAEMLCAMVSLAMGYSIPFTPAGIIWLNGVIAALGAFAIWREPYHRPRGSHGKKELRSMKKGSIAHSTILGALLRGLLMGVGAMLLYAASVTKIGAGERRTAVFITLCTAFVLMAQSCRSDEPVIKRINHGAAAWICFVLGIAATVFVLKADFMAASLGVDGIIRASTALGAVGCAAVVFILAELGKLIIMKSLKRRKA